MSRVDPNGTKFFLDGAGPPGLTGGVGRKHKEVPMAPIPCRVAIAMVIALVAVPAAAQLVERPAARCQDAIGKGGAKFKKIVLARSRQCYEHLLRGDSCNTALRDRKIAAAADHYGVVVGRVCTSTLLFSPPPAGLGFAQSCVLEPFRLEPGEQACAALPVTDAGSFAGCLVCWKKAELNELLKIVYPCLASQVPEGSDLDCGTPPSACPTDSGGIRCTKNLARGAQQFLLAKESALERCLKKVIRGTGPGPCPDAKAQKVIDKYTSQLTVLALKCPAAPPWWDVCPEMCSLPIATVDDIEQCIAGSAEAITDELVCLQYPSAGTNGISCPPGDE